MTAHKRQLVVLDHLTDFSSNDYLGLATSEELNAIFNEMSLSHGSTGSRLLTGNHKVSTDVEAFLAERWGMEGVLIFPSGYMANLGLLSAIGDRHSTIIYDSLAHACIKDGARLSQAQRLTFRHNDPAHLEARLKDATGTVYVVVESLYSMDGDVAPLESIVELCEQYNARLIVDEAHATAVIGEYGGGFTELLGLSDRIFARINTFGKGLGLHGASVSGPAWLKDHLVNTSRPFIYTTAPPPALFMMIREAFTFLDAHTALKQKLNDNISWFLSEWQRIGPGYELLPADHAIQAVIVPGEASVKQLAAEIQQQGMDVRPILSPTVPAGTERIRICLHAFNSKDEITQLIGTLAQ